MQRVSELAAVDVADLLLDAPAEVLSRPEHTQLVVFTTSVLAITASQSHLPAPVIMAGHSLGEVTALWASGALGLDDAVRVVVARSATTDAVARRTRGAMAAILGLATSEVATVCAQFPAVWVANDNCRGQVVITGLEPGISAASEALRAQRAKVIRLPIGGAFHCPVMEPARHEFAAAIASLDWQPAQTPVVSNADAQVRSGLQDWPTLLADQLVGNVRWVDCTHQLLDRGVDTIIEFGPGAVLTGLTKRNAPHVRRFAIDSPAALATLLANIAD